MTALDDATRQGHRVTARDDATFITRMDPPPGDGPRLAVKDLIDVAGTVTTCGLELFARTRGPAARDATCVARARQAGARIVGKTNLHPLGIGSTGINRWAGTPTNPLDPELVPGGSSSGSAVAVATGVADVAYGTDAGGSCRVPAACCGIAGLKTTHGRIPTAGLYPVAPSIDSVGPIARDVEGLVLGMRLLEPGFAPGAEPPHRVGRVRAPTEPAVDVAIDRALDAWGVDVVEVPMDGWDLGFEAMSLLFLVDFHRSNGHLLDDPDALPPGVAATLRFAAALDHEQRADADAKRRRFGDTLDRVLSEVEVIALPTLPRWPPRLDTDDPAGMGLVTHTAPVNAAGVPALAMPVPTDGTLPASLQLVGPHGGEELLLASGLVLEAAVTVVSRAGQWSDEPPE